MGQEAQQELLRAAVEIFQPMRHADAGVEHHNDADRPHFVVEDRELLRRPLSRISKSSRVRSVTRRLVVSVTVTYDGTIREPDLKVGCWASEARVSSIAPAIVSPGRRRGSTGTS